MTTSREIITAFGQTAVAYWTTANLIYDAPHIECATDMVFENDGSGWMGKTNFVAEMETEAGFSFDVDPSGRWWICYMNGATLSR